MAYTINKTDGSILTTVADGQVDSLSTDISLIGKNYSGFGEILNENLIKMLENFASVSRPTKPLRGEIWFDSSESRLKVYNGVDFATVGSATISALQPTTLNPGDLWFNETDKQLYFFDGSNTILLGPLYSSLQGVSGFRVETITDTLNQSRVIAQMFVGGVLVGIFSKDGFTPKSEIVGFAGSIVPGFNVGTISGIKVNATSTNSEQLAGKSAELYVTKDTNNIINGTVSLTNDAGLTIGSTPGNGQFFVDAGDIVIANTAQDRDFRLVVRRGILPEIAIEVVSATQTMNLYGNNIDSTVVAGGSLVVNGNLTVNGTTTSVSSTTLEVKDKNIELAKTSVPSDASADGGGITLKGTTDKTIVWTDTSDAWNSSEHINLEAGRSYKINGVVVIDENGLGPGITSAPGITSFGVQAELTVDNLYINGNTIESTNFNGNIILSPAGTGTVDISTSRISGLGQPLNPQDAATKEYVDNRIELDPLIFSMDISSATNQTGYWTNADIANQLTILAPPSQFRNGKEARILCVAYTTNNASVDINSQFVKNKVTAVTSPSGTSDVLADIALPTIVIPGQTLTINRFIKIFRIQAGVWTSLS